MADEPAPKVQDQLDMLQRELPRYQRDAERIIHAMLKDDPRVLVSSVDLFQSAFKSVWRQAAAGKMRAEDERTAWAFVHAVLRRKWIDYLVRRKRLKALEQADPEGIHDQAVPFVDLHPLDAFDRILKHVRRTDPPLGFILEQGFLRSTSEKDLVKLLEEKFPRSKSWTRDDVANRKRVLRAALYLGLGYCPRCETAVNDAEVECSDTCPECRESYATDAGGKGRRLGLELRRVVWGSAGARD